MAAGGASSSVSLQTKITDLMKLGKKGLSPDIKQPAKRNRPTSPNSDNSDDFDLREPPVIDPEFSSYLDSLIETKIIKAIQPYVDLIRQMEATIQEKDERIRVLESQLAAVESTSAEAQSSPVSGELEKAFSELSARCDSNEQHSRNYNLRVSGIVVDDNLNPETLFCDIGRAIGVEIAPTDLRNCHLLRPSRDGKKANLIATFRHYPTRTRFISARKALKNVAQFKGVYINEDLTPPRYTLLRALLDCKHDKQIASCWSSHGNLFYKLTENDRPEKVKRPTSFNIKSIVPA